MDSIVNSRKAALAAETTHTRSLCPVCLARIDAWHLNSGGDVWLLKRCPQHGDFKVPVWRGEPDWNSWRRPKLAHPPPSGGNDRNTKGCPFDCGLCSRHRQRSCTVLIEVTGRCNLVCPVCFAASSPHGPADPTLDELVHRFAIIARLSPGCNIQLSGGEPTLRDDLPEIVAAGKRAGFDFIQVNTNGIRPARDRGCLHRLASAGVDSFFLQFDGTRDDIYRKLRGRALLETKLKTIAACGEAGIGVVLVVTVVPGVNDHDLGRILELAVERVPTVRGVHLQPISYFGRYPAAPADEDRITLPELMRAIDTQTRGAFPMTHFSPPGCENAMCSFSAKFLIGTDHAVRPLLPAWQRCCGAAEPAETGARRSISQTARQWSAAPRDTQKPMRDGDRERVAPMPAGDREPMDLDCFIGQVRTRTLAVSAMAFQDAWSLDLERVRDCCIHVADDGGRLIPFCLYNLTGTSGQSLYRT
jgi:uncharacterized radical SAM superfamily Fe-S cluster-containing enzyme